MSKLTVLVLRRVLNSSTRKPSIRCLYEKLVRASALYDSRGKGHMRTEASMSRGRRVAVSHRSHGHQTKLLPRLIRIVAVGDSLER